MFKIDQSKCVGCQKCIEACPSSAIKIVNKKVEINQVKCRECGICSRVCPENAIYIDDTKNKDSQISFSTNMRRDFSDPISDRGFNKDRNRGRTKMGRGQGKRGRKKKNRS